MPATRPLHCVAALLVTLAGGPAAAPPAAARPAAPAADTSVASAAPANDLAPLTDEFTAPASLAGWRQYHEAEGWPNMLRRAEVRPGGAGELYLEPTTSGWYADFHAPFLYKEVAGDFEVTARVLAEGLRGGVPRTAWSLGGLMVRAPRAVTAATWTPAGENWLFITAGVADDVGRPVLETKNTAASRSALRLHPVRAGWVELRVRRAGASFELASRHPGEDWVVRAQFARPDLPATLQVGINAYSDWNHAAPMHNDPARFNTTVLQDGTPDLGLRVDWVRFARPARAAG
jgi:hypothetical protein